jgi:DnaJ-class molecular chaperone
MKDYYKTLGIERGATKEDIKKAFRKIAHEHHPDKTKNDPASAQKFKEASEAYSVLSDDQKRKQYDTFGSAGPGFNPGAGGFGGQGFGGANGFDFSGFAQNGGFNFSQGGVEFDLGDLFGEFFGGQRRPRRGRNIQVDVEISFKESIFGTEKDIAVGKEHYAVKIPPGIESNQGLRISGKGEEGPGGRGDLIVRVWVKEHPSFRKERFNIVTEADVKLTTALAGGTIELETLEGRIELKVPAGTNHGDVLRVKGKGVPYETQGMWGGSGKRGDLLVVIHVAMPRKLSKAAQKAIEDLKKEGL